MPKWSAFGEIFLSHLHGKNVNLLSSTTHWRKSGCLNEKSELLSKSFSHDLSGQEKVNWPKKSENKKTALSQKRLCDGAA